MTFKIIKTDSNTPFIVQTSGEFSNADHALALKTLTEHPDWKRGTSFVMDHRECSFKAVTVEEIDDVINSVQVIEQEFGRARCAVVAPIEGFSKHAMYKFNREMTHKIEHELFDATQYEEALEWCSEKNP